MSEHDHPFPELRKGLKAPFFHSRDACPPMIG